jgi:hypothetical protein
MHILYLEDLIPRAPELHGRMYIPLPFEKHAYSAAEQCQGAVDASGIPRLVCPAFDSFERFTTAIKAPQSLNHLGSAVPHCARHAVRAHAPGQQNQLPLNPCENTHAYRAYY